MQQVNITKKIVLKNKVLKLGFSAALYKSNLDLFVLYANEGAKIDPKIVLHELLRLYCHYCGVSYTYRTVFYDFSWAVLEINPQFWNEEETENGFSDMGNHDAEFYPEFNSKGYDVATLDYGEYLVTGLNMLNNNVLNKNELSIFSYALFVFFERWKFQFNEDIISEVKEKLKEEKENLK